MRNFLSVIAFNFIAWLSKCVAMNIDFNNVDSNMHCQQSEMLRIETNLHAVQCSVECRCRRKLIKVCLIWPWAADCSHITLDAWQQSNNSIFIIKFYYYYRYHCTYYIDDVLYCAEHFWSPPNGMFNVRKKGHFRFGIHSTWNGYHHHDYDDNFAVCENFNKHSCGPPSVFVCVYGMRWCVFMWGSRKKIENMEIWITMNDIKNRQKHTYKL